jgi:rhodanese-related sulfurtransferase
MTYDIKCAQIRDLVDNGGQLIDVRSNHEFTQGALKNAVNVPVESLCKHHR